MRLSIFKDNLGCNCHYFFKGEPIFTTLPRSRLFTFLRPMSRVACDGVSSKCKHRKPMISPSPRQTSTASDPAEFVFYGRGQKSRRGRRCISIKKEHGTDEERQDNAASTSEVGCVCAIKPSMAPPMGCCDRLLPACRQGFIFGE